MTHYFVRNYDIRKVIRLMCYSTQYPHTLSSTQKITRIYRSVLRRQREWTMNQNRCDPDDYYHHIRVAREKLEEIMDVSESSPKFGQTLEYFEQRIRLNLDPTMLINDSRQYSPVNGRAHVWDNYELKYGDPFGYYKGKLVTERLPTEGFVYYPDFPHDSTIWAMDPPSEYKDEVDTESFSEKQESK